MKITENAEYAATYLEEITSLLDEKKDTEHRLVKSQGDLEDLKEQFITACRFLPDKEKHLYLLSAPEKDTDGNPYVIRYNRTEDTHYVASEKDGKKTKWTALFSNGEWVQTLKS